MNAVVATRSSGTQLGELDIIERHLKKARDNDDLRKVCLELNRFREHLREETLEVRARYSFLRGMLYTKVGACGGLSFLGSSGECLLYALDQFADADEALQRWFTDTARPSGDLIDLRRATAYEACVVLTTLRVWGRWSKELFSPDTSLLDPGQQKKVSKALSAYYILPSRF